MPVSLTTPKNTGDLDPSSAVYAEAKIVFQSIDVEVKAINVKVQYGNTVSGVWEKGILKDEWFVIKGADYDTVVASSSSAAGEIYYEKVAAVLYQWLIDNGHFVGTIV